jgi:CDP-glycerol glycerophosphotransferase (TagB/SpsB family)
MIQSIKINIKKFIGWFIPQNKKNIFCFPNEQDELMDILNYTHDAVLSLLHYIITFHDNDNFNIFLVNYSNHRYNELLSLASSLKNIKLKFIPSIWLQGGGGLNRFLRIKYDVYFFSSKYIITGSSLSGKPLKLKKQIAICINYYSPFKNDLVKKFKSEKYNQFDCIIMSSKICSQIDSIASRNMYTKYRSLGLPKEDHIINPRFTKNEIFKKLNIPENINKLVLYTPTHRDYEEVKAVERNVFGYEGCYNSLNQILIRHNTILFIKLHPGQIKEHIVFFDNLSNIQLFQSSCEYTLYDIIPFTDLLITDYSSLAFDFMLTNKPIIYNFFDREIYEKTRGFSWDPVEIICAGPIVNTKNTLETVIDNILSGKDYGYKEKYEWVRQLTHAYTDGKACERIYSLLIELFKHHHF